MKFANHLLVVFLLVSATVASEEFGGIGVSLEGLPGRVQLRSVIPGGSAYLQGLRSGDQIESIDGKAVNGNFAKIIEKMRGKIGSEFKLTVKRLGKSQALDMRRQSILLLNKEELEANDYSDLALQVTRLGYRESEIGAILQDGRPLLKWQGEIPENSKVEVVLFSSQRRLDLVIKPNEGLDGSTYRFFQETGATQLVEWRDMRGRVLKFVSSLSSESGWLALSLYRAEFENMGVIVSVKSNGRLRWSGPHHFSGE